MIKEAGGEVAGILTIIELSFLEPRKKLKDYQVKALITY